VRALHIDFGNPVLYPRYLKILIFSDIHGDWKTLERHMAAEADVYVCAGDITNFGRKIDEAGEVMKARGSKVKIIPGNHETEEQVARFCDQFGFENFHGKVIDVAGHKLAGLGYSNLTPFQTPGEYTEEQLAWRLELFAEVPGPMILACHCPPFQTSLDRMRQFRHGGSTAVRDFLAKRQPDYFFCGHIHEAAGTAELLGTTKAMNVGKQGYLLDLNPELIRIQYPGAHT